MQVDCKSPTPLSGPGATFCFGRESAKGPLHSDMKLPGLWAEYLIKGIIWPFCNFSWIQDLFDWHHVARTSRTLDLKRCATPCGCNSQGQCFIVHERMAYDKVRMNCEGLHYAVCRILLDWLWTFRVREPKT